MTKTYLIPVRFRDVVVLNQNVEKIIVNAIIEIKNALLIADAKNVTINVSQSLKPKKSRKTEFILLVFLYIYIIRNFENVILLY